jgi:hypothetical protein
VADNNEINKRTSNLRPYQSAAEKMKTAGSARTAEMIEQQSAISRLESQRNNTLNFLKGVQEGTTPFDAKVFQSAQNRDSRIKESIDLHQEKLRVAVEKRELSARNQFATSVRNLSQDGVNSSSPIEEARALVQAQRALGSGSYNESSISKGLRRLPNSIASKQGALISTAEDPKGSMEDFLSAAGSLEGTKDKYRTVRAAGQELKRLGLDSVSVLRGSQDLAGSIGRDRASTELSSRVSSGATGSIGQETAKLKEAEDRFLEAQDKFTKALADGTPDIEDFKKAVLGSTKSLEDQKKLVKEMERQGAGGGAGAAIGKYGPMVGQAINAASDIYMNATVNSENQQMGLRASFARVQNRAFMDHYGATQGDMSALMMVDSSAAGKSAQFGTEQGNQAKGAMVGSVAGSAVETGTGILADALDFKFGSALKTAIGGSSNIANKTIDVTKGLTEGNSRIQGDALRYDLARATNEVKSAAVQQFYNSSMGNYQATVGFGQAGSDVFKSLQSNRRAFSNLGLGAEETQGLYSAAIGSMGSEFTKKGTAGMQSMVERSGQVQLSGITSAQDYISRIGQLSQTGGGSKQVEDVLANAVARGVDNAKSFGDMINAISDMSSSSAAMGVDTSGAATKALLASMDVSSGNGIAERLNMNVAQQQSKRIDELAGGTTTTFGKIMEQANLAEAFGATQENMSARTNFIGVGLKPLQQIQEDIQAGKTTKALTQARRLGISDLLFDDNGGVKKNAIEKSIKIKQQEIADEGAIFLGKGARDRLASGQEALSEAERSARANIGILDEGVAQISGKGFAKGSIKESTGDRAAAANITKAKAGSEAAMTEGGEALKSLSSIAATMQSLANTLQPVAAAGRSNEAAASMKLETSAFDGSVTKFESAVQKLIDALGEKGGPRVPTFNSRQQVKSSGISTK